MKQGKQRHTMDEKEYGDERSRTNLVTTQIHADIQAIMKTPAGRRVFWYLLGKSSLASTPFHSSGSVTAFNCGMQNYGLQLQAELATLCPKEYLQMQMDHMDE